MVVETALDGMKKNQLLLTVSFQLENVPFSIKSYRVVSQIIITIMTHNFAFGYFRKGLQSRNFYCPTFQIFIISVQLGGGGGGQNLSISSLKQSCFCQGHFSLDDFHSWDACKREKIKVIHFSTQMSSQSSTWKMATQIKLDIT